MSLIYVDNNATTRMDDRVFEAMKPYFCENYYNPSSIYLPSQNVRKEIDTARENLAKLLRAQPEEIIFTSGGTESDNIAIKGTAFLLKEKGNHIITSAIEHHAVLNTCKYLEKQGFKVTYLPVDMYGIVNLEALRQSITDETILVTIMFANNEIGTIEPIEEIGKILKEINAQRQERGKQPILFHTDAVQIIGKIKIDVQELGVDLLSLSGHKFYGPKGIGALFVKKGVKFHPLTHGGHHEFNKRAGTENVPGIIGLGKAAEIALNEMVDEEILIKQLRDKLENSLKKEIPEIIINGHPERRLYNTTNICIKHVEGESILIHLDLNGICASSGSACTSGSLEPSHVLLAIGLKHEIAHGSLRFSLGKYNTEAEIDKIIDILPPIVEKLRKISPFWEK